MAPVVRHQPLDPAALRRAVGLDIPGAAARTGCDRRSLIRYELRQRIPDAALVLRLAEVYGLGDDQVGALARWWEVARD